MKMKMICLTIRIKRNDEANGKRLNKLLIDFFMQNKIAGATVWSGVDGFGKRRRSTIKLEGITVNMPLIMEVIDLRSKIEPLLFEVKRMVGDNGLVTLQEVDVI
jgi:PII-like signaling protein